jgi:hypothetical protein
MLLISFSFNQAFTLSCLNTRVFVLIKQYSTGLLVSYFTQRPQSHEKGCFKKVEYLAHLLLLNWAPGAEFTTLNFLLNLRTGPINESVWK